MNAQKFTQKSLEAIQNAQNLAVQNQCSQIEEEHLLLSLLEQEDSLIKELLKKIGIADGFEKELKQEVSNKPRMTGATRSVDSIYIAQDVDFVLVSSEQIASKMQDEYVSVEHIMLALLDNPNKVVKELFNKYKLNKNDFLKALSSVRGNTRVTSDNPESTYNVLKKDRKSVV